jgi:hypothetical protein
MGWEGRIEESLMAQLASLLNGGITAKELQRIKEVLRPLCVLIPVVLGGAGKPSKSKGSVLSSQDTVSR